MKHISPTFMYIIPMYLRLRTFTKTLPQMSFHLDLLLFLFRSGARFMTQLTAGALTDPQLPTTASNACTADARLGGVGGVPPPPILATPLASHSVQPSDLFVRWMGQVGQGFGIGVRG